MLERLTVYIDGEAREDHSRDTGRWKNGSRACMKRLAAYEDTGLTPEEIAALKAENDLLKRTILDMKEQYENPPTRTCTTYRATLTQHDSAQDGQEGGNA